MTGPLSLAFPVLAQILLTLVLMLLMGRARVAAVRRGEVRVAEIALGERIWPRQIQQISNSAHNQFETPILFYVLCGLAMATDLAGAVPALLAWAYVGTRVGHAYVHTTSNSVGARFRIFAVGILILSALWLLVLLRLLGAA